MNKSRFSLKTTLGAFDRRQFLETAGMGLVSAGVIHGLNPGRGDYNIPDASNPKSTADAITIKLPSLEQASEKDNSVTAKMSPPDKRIGYAIVGLGHLSLAQILPAFGSCKYSKPVALVSGDAAKAKNVAAQHGIPEKNIYNYQNFDQIGANPEIDAVYIVLPNSMHEEFTVRAAKAGKHVLCEKPMATSSKEAQNMIDACKKAGKKLMIAYRIQYEPHNRLAMKWAREQHFGKVKLIEGINSQNIGDPAQWRLRKNLSGGGSLPDIGLYCLNTSRFILGEEPYKVIASSFSTPDDPRFKEVEESVMFQLHFPSGAIVNASTSYGVHTVRRYRCYGDNGGWFGLDPAFEYENIRMEASKAEGKMEVKQEPKMTPKQQFALEMDHFSQCVMDDKSPFTPGEEGLQDHKIMEAIYESARMGKVVQLEKITKMDAFRGTPPQEEA